MFKTVAFKHFGFINRCNHSKITQPSTSTIILADDHNHESCTNAYTIEERVSLVEEMEAALSQQLDDVNVIDVDNCETTEEEAL